MNDALTVHVRSAAKAMWWTLLISIAFLIAATGAYRGILVWRPGWILQMWAPDLTWGDFEHMSLWAIIVLRFVVWMMLLTAIWLSIWARKLRKAALP